MKSSPSPTALVVGAGLGGLAVAARLAQAGWRVTVCERHTRPGGKMNRRTAAGFTFDTGPSLITMPFVFDEWFAALGERRSAHLDFLRVEPLADYVFDDGVRFRHTASLPDWLPVVRGLEGGSAEGFFNFLALGARLFALSQATFFKTSPGEPPPRDAWKALRHLPLRNAWGVYARTVERHFRSPHLRQMFLRYITYVGSSPWRAPATLAVIPAIEYLFGGWHIRGGLYRLVEVLADLARARGAELRLSAPVDRIEHDGRRVRGVRLAGGERLAAEVVVFNGDAARLDGLLGDAPAPSALPPARRSLSGLVLLYALRRTWTDALHHRVFFSADYRREFRELFDERRFPSDPTVYVNMPSRTDSTLTPGEGETLFVMANAPAGDGGWDDAALETARARMLDRLFRSGFPDFRGEVVHAEAITPRALAEDYDMPGGSIYGQVSHGWKGAFLRPSNRVRRLRGLYGVGGSFHPGGGTPTVLMSARLAADLILRHETRPG